jgi:anaerobic magnesium-protoporphyrin IX monomethyl ester cyclase
MKILLIRPKTKENFFSAPPTGLCYIKSTLVNSGYHQTKVIDIDRYSEGYIIKTVSEFQPDIVGISCLTELRMYALKLAKIIKLNFAHIIMVFGGIHPTHLYQQMLLSYAFIDYIFIGEGEITFVEFVQALEGEVIFENVAGIAYRKNKHIHKNVARLPIRNLDELPFPDYSDFNLYKYEILFPYFERKPILFVVSSRGCVNRCVFCSTSAFWEEWRKRSPENIICEINHLVDKYNVKTIKFADDIFTVDKKRTIEICDRMIEEKYDIYWSALTRVDYFDEEIAMKMRDAGCRFLSFGTESASDEILKKINKRQTSEDIYRAFDICRNIKLTTELALIVGNPGENDQSIEDNIKLIRYVKPEIFAVSMMTLLPDTPLYKKSLQEGLCSDDFWLTEKARLRYTGAISYKQMLKYQRKLYFAYIRSKGFKGLWFTIKYALKLLLRDRERMLPHFISGFLGKTEGL